MRLPQIKIDTDNPFEVVAVIIVVVFGALGTVILGLLACAAIASLF